MKDATTPTRLRPVRYDERPRPMTLEEYAESDEPEDGYRYELVRGQMLVQEPAPGGPHGHSQNRLVWRLNNWMQAFGQGEVFA